MSSTSGPYSPNWTDRVTLAVKKDNLEVEEIIVNKTLIALQLKSQILHNVGHSSEREFSKVYHVRHIDWFNVFTNWLCNVQPIREKLLMKVSEVSLNNYSYERLPKWPG